jgi:hypothetical protein
MAFTNIIELEQYLYCLSMELHTNSFEIVTVQLKIYAKRLIEKLNVLKIKYTNESGVQKKMNVINKLDLTNLISIIK